LVPVDFGGLERVLDHRLRRIIHCCSANTGIWWAIVDQVANFFLTLHEPTYLPTFDVAAK